jgi:hypothetical protein
MAGDTQIDRRGLLAATGAAAVGLAGCGSRSAPHGWLTVDAPDGGTLYDVVVTRAGPIAVGESGRVLARRNDAWGTVVDDGPGGNGSELLAAAVTDDGQRMWAAGSSGAVARYDTATGQLDDLSAPLEKTSTWEAVAATGRTGGERVHLVNGSGELLSGQVRNGTVRWGKVTKPTGGESATTIDYARTTGYIGDTAGSVYRTKGSGWSPVGVGGADATVHDLAAATPRLVNVVTHEGSIYLYTGYNWLALAEAEDPLHAIDRREGRGVAGGHGGTVYELVDDGWEVQDTPTDAKLYGVAVGRYTYADVAVGENGTVMERFG